MAADLQYTGLGGWGAPARVSSRPGRLVRSGTAARWPLACLAPKKGEHRGVLIAGLAATGAARAARLVAGVAGLATAGGSLCRSERRAVGGGGMIADS